jgi:hypothetical protein
LAFAFWLKSFAFAFLLLLSIPPNNSLRSGLIFLTCVRRYARIRKTKGDEMKGAKIRILFAVLMFLYVMGAFQSLDQMSAQGLQRSLMGATSAAFPSLPGNSK